MKEYESFSQLLDAVQDRTGYSDDAIAHRINSSPGWISQCRNGRQNAGPKLWRKVEALLGEAKPSANHSLGAAPLSGLDALRKTAEKHGVDPGELLDVLVLKHGWAEAEALKTKTQRSPVENTGAVKESLRIAKAINPTKKAKAND